MTDKERHERDVFSGFVAASALPIDPVTVENRQPPEPDIRCMTPGGPCGFELSEILAVTPDERVVTLAHGFDHSLKKSKRKAELRDAGENEAAEEIQSWDAFGYDPLVSLLRALRNKCKTRHTTNGYPVHLLLYYDLQTPFEPFDRLGDYAQEIRELLAPTHFVDVWIYHHVPDHSATIPAALALQGVKLADFQNAGSLRAVVGHISKANGEPWPVFDVFYSREFERQAGFLVAFSERRHRESA
jgi:hypothetical protein